MPPISILTTDINYNSIQLSWTTPNDGGSRIKGFIIHYKQIDGHWEEIQVGSGSNSNSNDGHGGSTVGVSVSGHRHSFVLKSLTCGSKYQIYITAFNKIGTGLPSQIVTAETKGNRKFFEAILVLL